MSGNEYLENILIKYTPRNDFDYRDSNTQLINILKEWATNCLVGDIYLSGSRAKGTAISLSSDYDYLVPLVSGANIDNDTSLKAIYNSLYNKLKLQYPNNIRKQNVSIRVELKNPLCTDLLEIDITPARRQDGYQNWYSLYCNKNGQEWIQTNIKRHIDDVSSSGRIKEIKLLKIWRELHKLDFPSIYLEYLLIGDILNGYTRSDWSPERLDPNFQRVLSQLSIVWSGDNPLKRRIVDPTNTNNILSNLLSDVDKKKIIECATSSNNETAWNKVVW